MSIETFLTKRNPELFSADLKRVINYVRLKDETSPVGTFKYEVFRYPNDVDIFEKVTVLGTEKIAAKKFCQRFQLMMMRLQLADPIIYFSDFKAGYDDRYSELFDLIDKKKIKKAKDVLDLLKHNNIIKKQWYDNCMILINICLTNDQKNIETTSAYKSLIDFVREKHIIRWNLEELTKNPPSKMLHGYKEISLIDALLQHTIVKLDVWAIIENRFVEVTNLFNLQYKIDNKIFTLSEQLKAYIPHMAMDVIKLQDENPLKSLKRLWILSQAVYLEKGCNAETKKEIKKYISKITPLMEQIPAKLGQINAQYELIAKIYSDKRIQKIPENQIKEQLFDLLNRIRDTLDETKYEDTLEIVNEKYKLIIQMVNNEITLVPAKILSDYVQSIMIIIRNIINEMTKEYISENTLNFSKITKFCERYYEINS